MSVSFKKLHNTFVVISLLILTSCEYIKAVDEVVGPSTNKTIYLIKKGEHSSASILQKVSSSSMRYEITFDNTAVYNSSNPENQGDINKLFGVSDCGTHHHTNSARFGWRWYNDRLEIHAYTYVNKVRSHQLVSNVELGRPYVYEIKFEDGQYVFLLNEARITMPRHCIGAAEGYMLYPYFGGNETAPHDISIAFNTVK